MAQLSNRPVTYADLEALPDSVVGEIVDGELFASPRPALPHANVSSEIYGELFGPFRRGRGGPGGWIILFEPELHLGDNVLVPDVAGWRQERMPAVPNEPWATLAPDWLAEVLSPSTAKLDRVRKLPAYARAGVAHVWMLDPPKRAFEVLRLVRAEYMRVLAVEGDQQVRAEPFDAIELDLAALWVS